MSIIGFTTFGDKIPVVKIERCMEIKNIDESLIMRTVIPFSIEQDVIIQSEDILFLTTANEILAASYVKCMLEEVEISLEYEKQIGEKKEKRDKSLH